MAAWTAAARQAANLARLTSIRSPPSAKSSSLIQRRPMSGGGDPHEAPKVDAWKDPLSPSKWKPEHFVIVTLSGWGVFIYGAPKLFKKKDKPEEKVAVAPSGQS